MSDIKIEWDIFSTPGHYRYTLVLADYTIVLQYGLSHLSCKKIQNSVAWIITNTRKSNFMTPALK